MVNVKYVLALVLAALLDIADYVAFAWLPFVGDLLDIVGVLLLAPLIGKYALLPLIELFPAVDFIPTFLVSVVLARSKFKLKKGEIV